MSVKMDSIDEKIDENKDLVDDVVKELHQLVIEDKKCITYSYLSLRFRTHVKLAIRLLDQFVERQYKRGNQLFVNYLLSGNNDSNDNDNEIKMERFMIVDESEVDSVSQWFRNGFTKHIYSVSVTQESSSLDLNFNEFDYEVKDKTDLNDLQKLTYITNDGIDFRQSNRRQVAKFVVKKEQSDNKSTTIEKQENHSKAKPKIISKGKNRSKKKITEMFSKNKKDNNEELVNNDDNDPFKSDSETEDKDKNEDSLTSKEISDEEIEEKVNIINDKRKSKNDSNDTSDEEEIFTIKKKSKKFKRIKIDSDSDSDDECKEKTAIDKFVNKNSCNNDIKKVMEQIETYEDEDGFLVTKKVKKEVTNDDKDNRIKDKEENANQENNEIKTKSEEKRKKTKNEEKSKQVKNEVTNVDNKSVKKPKTQQKDKNGMTQSSITSFFKPKQIN